MRIERDGAPWPAGWAIVQQGGAGPVVGDDALRLVLPANTGRAYANAQMDDHSCLPRRGFAWRPPLQLTLRARFSHDAVALKGTAGFGFWNDPFGMAGTWPPAPPQAAWFFFASPPSNMPLASNVPGHGLKAALIDARRPAAYALLPFAPLLMPLLRWPRAHRTLWPTLQRAIGVKERILDAPMTDWHTYAITWLPNHIRFEVDGVTILESVRAPHGPLGLVVWIDNQFLVATPQGRLRHGCVGCEQAQSLEIAELTVCRSPSILNP